MVVQGGHLKALGKQLAHHRIDFAFGQDEVAHHHGLVAHRLESDPAAEGEAGLKSHSVQRNVEVAAGQPIAMHVARDGSRPGQDRVDNEPVRLRRCCLCCAQQRKGPEHYCLCRTHARSP